MTSTTATKTFPLIEVFGPTIQGEGFLAGLPTHFLRFGLCDFRCEWCDSMFAVEPTKVKEHAEHLTAEEMVDRLVTDRPHVPWVTISGGNPAIHELGDLVELLREHMFQVTVETQGSIWRDWLAHVDHLTVSPKPPSSGMVNHRHDELLTRFLAKAELMPYGNRSIKIVVFDDVDLEWARPIIYARNSDTLGAVPWETFLSVGTDPVTKWGTEWAYAESHPYTVRKVAERYGWLCNRVAGDAAFSNTRVLPQLHVIGYGHKRGV